MKRITSPHTGNKWPALPAVRRVFVDGNAGLKTTVLEQNWFLAASMRTNVQEWILK